MSETTTPGYLLLEDGSRFDGVLCGAPRRRDRRGRLHDRDERLPGVGHRPVVRRPDHRLHLPAHRELRRQHAGDGVRPGPRPRRSSCARRSTARTRRPPSADGSTGCATAAFRRSAAWTRASLVRHIRTKGSMRGGHVRRRTSPRRPRSTPSPPSRRCDGLDLAREVDPGGDDRARGRQHGPADRGDRHRHQALDRPRARRPGRTAAAAPVHRQPPRSCSRRTRTPIFLANGPGDPAALDYVVETVRARRRQRGRRSASAWATSCSAARVGLETFKLPFGHRGGNHPVKDLRDREDRDHLAEPRLRGRGARRRAARRDATSRCAGRPSSAPPSSRT